MLAAHPAPRASLQVGFGERVRLLGGDGIRHPLWVSFEALGRHVAFFLDNVPLNRWEEQQAAGGGRSGGAPGPAAGAR